MKPSARASVQQLNCVLIAVVLVTCILVTLAGWKWIGVLTQRPSVRNHQQSSSNFFSSLASNTAPTVNQSKSLTEAASRPAVPQSENPRKPATLQIPLMSAEQLQCTVDSQVSLGGKALDRCAALEAAKLAQDEDIYVSVKTTPKYHSPRMLPILQTWFQTLPANQVICCI